MEESTIEILKNLLLAGSIGVAGYALINLKSYNDEKSSYHDRIAELNKENKDLKKKLNLKSNEFNELKNKELQKQRDLRSYEIKINSLKSEIEEKSKELEDIKKTNDIIVSKNINAIKEIEILNQKLSKVNNYDSYDKNRIRQLENEIVLLKNKLKQVTLENVKDNTQNDIDSIKNSYETENKNLNNKISELEKVINDLNKKINENNIDVIKNRYKKEIDKLKDENSDLISFNTTLKTELEQLKNNEVTITSIRVKDKEKIENLKNIINELEEKINLLNTNVHIKDEESNNNVLDEIAQSYEEEFDDENKDIIQDIEGTNIEKSTFNTKNIFNIKNSNQVLFKGNIEDIEETLDKIKNVENIKNYLLSWDIEEKDIFIKIINKYEKSLEKMIKKLDLDEDDEELFEIVTEDFFNNLDDTFISKLIVSIYRGIKNNNHEFYKGFIKEVNDYLNLCNIYTRNIEVDCQIKDDDYYDMEIIPKKINDKSLHNKIEEVEMLPYYINYINDVGDIKTMTIKGKMTVCSANL